MNYKQILLLFTLLIGVNAFAQTSDEVRRAFEEISQDELDRGNTSPEEDEAIRRKKVSSTFMRVYPNPSKGGASKVTLRTPGPDGSNIRVSVIDPHGFEFNVRNFTSTGSSFEYNLAQNNNVKPGIYTVKVIIADEILTEQWMVQ